MSNNVVCQDKAVGRLGGSCWEAGMEMTSLVELLWWWWAGGGQGMGDFVRTDSSTRLVSWLIE